MPVSGVLRSCETALRRFALIFSFWASINSFSCLFNFNFISCSFIVVFPSYSTNAFKDKSILLPSTFNTNIVGIIDHIKLIKTKNNDDMGFITIKDDVNKLKIVLFPKTYKNYSHLLKVGLCIAVKGHLENEKDLSFIANEIEILEENK